MISTFVSVFDQSAGAVVGSNAWTADHIGTAVVSGAVLYKNGIAQGDTCTYVHDDVLHLQLTAASTDNTTLFAVYSLNGHEGVWSVATANVDNYPLQFSFTGVIGAIAGSTIQSSSFVLQRLTKPVAIKVAPVNRAQLYKNGVASGLSVVAENGDSIYVECTPTDSISYVPVSVGAYVENFSVQTVQVDTHPTIPVFAPAQANPDQVVTSSTYTVAGLETQVQALAADAVLLHNGVAGAGPVLVSNGDTLALQITAGSHSRDVAHAVLRIGDVEVGWVVTTLEQAAHYRVTPANLGRPLLDSAFVADNSDNRIFAIDSTLACASRALDAEPTFVDDQTEHLFLASYYEDCVYVLSTTDQQVLFKIDMGAGSRPYAVAHAPTEFLGNKTAYKFVTLSGTKKVVQLDPDQGYAVLATFSLPASPMGIACDNAGVLHVACDDGTVVLFGTNDLVTYAVIGVEQVGTSLLEVCAAGDTVFVSDYVENKVYKFVGTAVVDTFDTGLYPLGLFYADGYLYSCDSGENTITKTDVATKEQIKIRTLAYPSSCSVDASDALWISHLGVSSLLKVDGAIHTVVPVPAPTFAVAQTEHGPIAASLYANLLSRVGPEVRTHSAMAQVVTPTTRAVLNTVLQLNERPSLITVSSVYDAFLYKNGVNVGQHTYAVAGDVVAVSSTSHSGFVEQNTIWLTVDGAPVAVTLTTINPIPNMMYFGGAFNQYLGDVSVSEEAVVSGLTDGTSVELTYDNPQGAIWVNGTAKGTTALVTNGDRIRLQSVAEGVYGESIVYKLTSGGEVVGTFRIQSIVLDGPMREEEISDYEGYYTTSYISETASYRHCAVSWEIGSCPDVHTDIVLPEVLHVSTADFAAREGTQAPEPSPCYTDVRTGFAVHEPLPGEAAADYTRFSGEDLELAAPAASYSQPASVYPGPSITGIYLSASDSLAGETSATRLQQSALAGGTLVPTAVEQSIVLLTRSDLAPAIVPAQTLFAPAAYALGVEDSARILSAPQFLRSVRLVGHIANAAFVRFSLAHNDEHIGMAYASFAKPGAVVYLSTSFDRLPHRPSVLEFSYRATVHETGQVTFAFDYDQTVHETGIVAVARPETRLYSLAPSFFVNRPEVLEGAKGVYLLVSQLGATRHIVSSLALPSPSALRYGLAPTLVKQPNAVHHSWADKFVLRPSGVKPASTVRMVANAAAKYQIRGAVLIAQAYTKERFVAQDNGSVPTGLFDTYEAALTDCALYGDGGVCSAYLTHGGKWTWRTEPDLDIVCELSALKAGKLPVAGWISGG